MKWPQLPDYGCIDRWPENGTGFIHTDDEREARECIPSSHVFRREQFDGEFYHCIYGQTSFRIRPCLWRSVAYEGLDIGDEVETIGLGMQRELFVGKVASMQFCLEHGLIHYQLLRGRVVYPRIFQATELRLINDKSRIRPRPQEFNIPHPKGKDRYRLRE